MLTEAIVGLFLAATLTAAAIAAEAPFDVVVIPSRGRTVAADLVELNGDEKTDLLQIVFVGTPPDEQRLVRVYFQTAAAALPLLPDLELPLPPDSAAYDLGDLRSTPGHELVLVRPSDVLILSLQRADADRWPIAVPGRGTVWPAEDDRGLERVHLISSDFRPEPLLLVPQLGSLAILSATGARLAELDVGGRANYLVPAQPGILFVESDLQLFFDGPRLSVGDADGDGRSDLIAATRHEVRLFLQHADGGFGRQPVRKEPLRVMSERNHLRGSGGVSVQARDLNGDGRADLLVSHLTGGLTDAHLAATVHLNRNGRWDLDRPDSTLESNAALGSDVLLDVDGDGRPELLRASIPFSVLELIEALLTRSVDARFSVYRFTDAGGFSREPWVTKKLDLVLGLETFRPRGFLPTWHLDLNGDGHLDLLTSGGGEEIEVSLGGPERRYDRRDARQQTDTEGLLRAGDLDGDGLPDIVLFNPLTAGAPLRVLRNRGALPGTTPRLSAPKP